jgi:hypothetical protein
MQPFVARLARPHNAKPTDVLNWNENDGVRCEAGQEIADRLERGRASFETAAFATSSG